MTKTILILAANPKNTSRLRLDQEVREIDNGLQRARRRDEFILKQVWAVRRSDFRRAMLDLRPNIVHFCGHGSGEEGIAFEDENGQATLISTEALSGFFELFANNMECVVLNACYSEVQAEAIAKHIPHVIGMNKAIGDTAAIEFAVAFYDALGAGETITFAYKLACNAIQLSGIPENLTPILKSARRATGSILEPDEEQLQEQIGQLSDNERKLFDALDEQSQYHDDIEVSAAETYYRTGNVFFVTQQYHQAIELYDKAISSFPDWPKPYLLKGMTFEQLGEWDKAREAYRLADRLAGPDQLAFASSLLNLAHCNFALGKLRETALLCDRVMFLVPFELSPVYTQSATRLAASAYQQLGDAKKEAEYLTRFTETVDKDAVERAAALRRLKEIERI